MEVQAPHAPLARSPACPSAPDHIEEECPCYSQLASNYRLELWA